MQHTSHPTHKKSPEETTRRTVGYLVFGLCILAFLAMLWLRSNQTLGGI